jgi:hypothetical protein
MIPPDLQPLVDRLYAPAGFALLAVAIAITLAATAFPRRLLGLALAQVACLMLLAMADAAGAPHARSAALTLAGLSVFTLALGVALLLRDRDPPNAAEDPPA